MYDVPTTTGIHFAGGIAGSRVMLEHGRVAPSPTPEGTTYLIQEGLALLQRGSIHIVEGKVIAPDTMSRHRSDQTLYDASRRIA